MYQVRLRSSKVRKQLDELSNTDYNRIHLKIMSLRLNPRSKSCKKLFDNIYRIRAGDFRIVYFINDKAKIIEIGKIARRRETTYKGMENLFSDLN